MGMPIARFLLIVSFCFLSVIAQATPSLTPATVTATRAPGQTLSEDKLLHLPADVTPQMADIIFIMDLTGSMGGAIANVKSNSVNANRLARGLRSQTWFPLKSNMVSSVRWARGCRSLI